MANTIVNLPNVRAFQPYPSLERTTTPNTIEYRNLAAPSTGIALIINVTAKTSSPSITVTLYGVDPYTDTTWTILTSAAIATVSTTTLRVHPGITAATNLAVADILPPNIRIGVTHSNTDAITYSVSGYLLY